MKLEKTFYTDSMKSYMILKGPADEKNPGYQYRMLSANTIGRMLSCSVRFIDNTCLFYYDVTSMQSMAVLYECRGMDRTAVRELLYGVLSAQQKLAAFLLDARRMIFDPECIFYDFEKKEYLFAYYPEDLEGNDCSVLYSYLAEHADPLDEPAVRIAYELSDIAMAQDGFLLTESYLDSLVIGTSGHEEKASGHGEKASAIEAKASGREAAAGPEEEDRTKTERDLSVDSIRYKELENKPREPRADVPYRRAPGKSDSARSLGGTSGIAAAGIFTAGMILFVLRLALKTEGQADSLIRSAVVSLMITSVILFLYTLAGCFKEDAAKMRREEESIAEAQWRRAQKARREELLIEFGESGADAEETILQGGGDRDRENLPGYQVQAETAARRCRLYGLGDARRYHIHLDELPCTVGSLAQFSDVVLSDQSISPLHVRFMQDGEDITLMDLNSMFGTYLNGERAEPGIRLKLEPCDEIRIGRLEFCYR
ncbi:MAG: FHA domain-containing protein [Lachnospiraceae bacterium]|nr:FHA domain-containing protein [Lachnospiraceae bacterium]